MSLAHQGRSFPKKNLPSNFSLAKSFPISFLSPAKLNLFFSLIAKREDGYHEIASLYQAINLFDTLAFSFSEKDHFTCSLPSLKMDEKNLVCRAAQLFRKSTGFSHPFSIHLEKNIPLEAGLGGGSSNAATTLFALNELSDHPLTLDQLIALAAQLGSDVPFFFSSGTAFCTAKGEKFCNIVLPFCFSGYLVIPPYGLSTKRVYENVQKEDLLQSSPEKLLEGFLKNKPQYINDLERSAFFLEPKLATVKKSLLNAGFEQVAMTGSGTAFFCLGRPDRMLSQYKPTQSIQRNSHSWYCI